MFLNDGEGGESVPASKRTSGGVRGEDDNTNVDYVLSIWCFCTFSGKLLLFFFFLFSKPVSLCKFGFKVYLS